MHNTLDKRVSLTSLLKLTLPTIIMMVSFSLYTVIDGVFVARYINSEALSSINITMPIINILLGIGVMFATGGSAIVAKYMGENKILKARESFSLITISALALSCLIGIVCIIFIKDIIKILGTTDLMYNYSYSYLLIMLVFTPFLILKIYFDYFLVTGGAPMLGLISSVAGGIINIVLDYLFIVKFNMGISGAAFATCIGYVIPSLIGISFFIKKSNIIHFVKPKFSFDIIKDCCLNGSSEMISQLSSSVTTFLYNIIMISYLGEDGVASITIILYIQILLNSACLGFTSGVSPRISYNYGSKDAEQVRNLVKYSYIIILIFALISFLICRSASHILVAIFVNPGSNIFNITLEGFNIFSLGFLMSGINIFTSGMFTAFSNGKISAMISSVRTLISFVIGIVILPKILGITGVWYVVPFAELTTLILCIFQIIKYRSKYMYGNIFVS
ncbi:MATE family efflux transporter [Metaclostridioides mangenotii]|uniref:MATE family efflux transporter n=1 Tax=Metaclostridioides mangenotii TaxID=1540 RepID=UPI00048A3F03|nr:MATE family efflux transporter [Clostridioides mangenotii]